MKKVLFLFTILISINSISQDVFPAYDISLLSEKELKVKPLPAVLQSNGYEGFYKDEKLKKKYNTDSYSYYSKYSSLVNKVFKVKNIIPYTGALGIEKFKLVLFSEETDEIYYDYDPRYEHKWKFEIQGELNLPKDFFCKDIEMTIDKFTTDTTYSSKAKDGITFIKVKKNGQESYYLSSNLIGNTLNIGEKGFILLFENNKKMEKPDVILDVQSASLGSGWIYRAFVRLSQDDINILTTNIITDKRHFIYDESVKNGKLLVEYLRCLRSR
jgi:hypothetical protein